MSNKKDNWLAKSMRQLNARQGKRSRHFDVEFTVKCRVQIDPGELKLDLGHKPSEDEILQQAGILFVDFGERFVHSWSREEIKLLSCVEVKKTPKSK